MGVFINTVDILGDDVLTDRLIDRSITEYHDDNVVIVGERAFNSCGVLASVVLPNASTIGDRAFNSCSALTSIDLPIVSSISDYAFYGSAGLTTLILRNTAGVVTFGGTNVLKNTQIHYGTGYIYVPRALVDSYKDTLALKNYANQFRALEDYTVDGTTTGELDPTKI